MGILRITDLNKYPVDKLGNDKITFIRLETPGNIDLSQFTLHTFINADSDKNFLGNFQAFKVDAHGNFISQDNTKQVNRYNTLDVELSTPHQRLKEPIILHYQID